MRKILAVLVGSIVGLLAFHTAAKAEDRKVIMTLAQAQATGQNSTPAESAPTNSVETEKVSGGVYLQVEAVSHLSRNKSEQSNLLGKIVYLEKEVNDDGLSVWAQAYSDAAFDSVYLGLAQKLSNFQVALGVGKARYDGSSRSLVNPWVYYGDEERGLEGLLYAEVYRGEPVHFYKGSFQKKFENGVIVGVYGESFAGIGPMLGYQFNEHFSVRVMIPKWLQPDEGRQRALVFFRIVFEGLGGK